MDKRIAIPAGLALMVALAVVGMLSIFSFTATQSAEASISEISQDIGNNVDLAKLGEPITSPLGTAAVTGSATAVQIVPDRPGATTRVELQFNTHPSSNALVPGTGQIVVRFDKDVGVPATLDRTLITMSTDSVSNSSQKQSDAVNPQSVSVDFVGTEDANPEVTLTVPDMILGDAAGVSAGAQGIGPGSNITIVFQQSLGITNATETDSLDVKVRTNDTSGNGDNVLTTIGTMDTPLLVQRSSDAEPRNESVTVTGLGIKGGQTVIFWLDVDGDGVRDASERDLCSAVGTSADIATCDFTTSNPPFIAGDGANCSFPVTGAFNCNYINARDGLNQTASQRSQADIDRSRMTLRSTVNVSPKTASVGDKVTISLFDYPTGHVIHKIELGGIAITDAATFATGPAQLASTPTLASLVTGREAIASSGQESFTFTIPGTVAEGGSATSTRIPSGVQRLRVRSTTSLVAGTAASGDQNRYTNITVGGANLSLSHQQIIGNQDLTISGNGFTEGTNICVAEGGVTLSNVSLQIDDTNDCPAATLAAAAVDPATGLAPERGVLLSSGGTFTLTVRVEQTDATMPTALLTEGNTELKVIDTSGAEGTVNVDIAPRSLSVNPLSARPRDLVTIIGTNFIADNADGLSATVNVKYECGSNSRETTADPDASGNFRETIRIPSNCAIPSTNTITATINAAGSSTGVVDTAIHTIPDALVTIDPVRGVAGNRVTVSGTGFRTFETLSKVEFGSLGTLGGRTANTDGNGDFSIDDIVVPGLDPGIHAVKVEVGSGTNRVTASTSFEVLPEGAGTSVVTPIADALEPLFTADTLDRAFFFNNVTKEWNFFINDSVFESSNDLKNISSGAPLWLKVTEDQSVDLGGIPFELTCVNPGTPEEDCWNLIVFP